MIEIPGLQLSIYLSQGLDHLARTLGSCFKYCFECDPDYDQLSARGEALAGLVHSSRMMVSHDNGMLVLVIRHDPHGPWGT